MKTMKKLNKKPDGGGVAKQPIADPNIIASVSNDHLQQMPFMTIGRGSQAVQVPTADVIQYISDPSSKHKLTRTDWDLNNLQNLQQQLNYDDRVDGSGVSTMRYLASRKTQTTGGMWDAPAFATNLPVGTLPKKADGGSGNPFKINKNDLNKFMQDPMGNMASAMINDYMNPNSMSNVITNVSDGVGMIDSYNKRKYDEKRLQEQGLTDNVIPVNQQSDRGDYVNTGSSYGMFRPDQMGAKSPEGMYNGMYYPSMALGGGIISEEMDNTPIMLGNTSTREMVSDIPEFATLPVGLASRKSFENSAFESPVYNANKEVDISKNTKFAYDYYTKSKKLPAHIAAGIVGNLYQESGLKPGAEEKTNTANGRGIAQWDKRDRWKGYLNWATKNGLNAYDLTSQLDYVLVEPGESSKALEKLKNTNTPEQAAVIFGRLYERPSEKHANWNTRTSVAKKLYNNQYKDGGELELTDEEIFEAKNNGYDVEFL